MPETDKPPFFKTWKGLYLFVLGNLAFMIILLYLFSISFK